MANISGVTHPTYSDNEDVWELYRYISGSGEDFIEQYLLKRDKERVQDFFARKSISYVPAYAKSAIKQIQNAVRQRMTSVKRAGGSENYKSACRGDKGGVDRKHSPMTKFMGDIVLNELTSMGTVGIYVDAPGEKRETLADDINNLPYLYTYKVEDIRAYQRDPKDLSKFTRLLLRDTVEVLDDEYGLSTGYSFRFRLLERVENTIRIRFFNADGVQTNKIGEISNEEYTLPFSEIPFVYLQISDSLLTDISRHQIALLNLASSDMAYVWNGNPTFLAETYDTTDPANFFGPGVETEDGTQTSPTVKVTGETRGVRVPKGTEYPAYISPDMKPLQASMEKQEQIKREILEIVNQSLKSISSKSTINSAVKEMSERKEEDGLKCIGDELEYGENLIAYFWSLYEGSEKAKVTYPESYEYKSDEQKREDAVNLSKAVQLTASVTAQKAIAKKAITALIGDDVTETMLIQIYKEIDAAPATISDPVTLAKYVENNIISPETAALLAGFTKDEAEKARLASIERARAIALAQSDANGARGVPDLSPDPAASAKAEKDANKMGV